MWVVISLSALVALVVFILSVPLDLTFRLEVYGRPRFDVRMKWLYGLVCKKLEKGEKKPRKKKKAVEGKRKPDKIWQGVKTLIQILRTKGLIKGIIKQIQKLIRGILASLRIRKLGAEFKIGLGNPADTGLLFALVGPVTRFLGFSRLHEIRLVPVLDRAVFEGYSYGEVRLRPIRLVPPVFGFVFSPTIMRIVKIFIISKWRGRK